MAVHQSGSSRSALRDAVRLSRSTLHATPYEIAAAAGCDPGTVKRRLMQPTARGVCDAAAAAAAHEDPSGCRWGPRLWEMCPPSCATAVGNYAAGPARNVYIGRDSGLRVHLMARTNTPLSAAFVVRSVRDPRSICAGAASKHEPIREAAARNPNCSFAALVRLADDDVAAIRGAVASNPGCPPVLLTILASDPAPIVRSAAVANVSCPEAALAAAAGDEFDVRWFLAGNPACPSEALDVIAEDPSFVLLHSVATNPNCSQQTLLRLAAWHPGAEVSDPGVARTRATDMRSFVASNPACPPQMLQQLAGDPATLVRAAAAANPDIAAGALQKLAASPDVAVQAAAAANPACPPQMIRKLVRSADPSGSGLRVISAAAANAACPQDLLRDLVRSTNPALRREVVTNPAATAEMLGWIAGCGDAVARCGAARHRSAPAVLVSRLARDASDKVRAVAVSNPACPLGELAASLDDPSDLVKTNAVAELARRSRTVP